MKILIACEFSGIVRDAFTARGHTAFSCDLLPSERPGNHYQCDVRSVLGNNWDMVVSFPPCTYLTKAGARLWNTNEWLFERPLAFELIKHIWNSCERVCIENPVGWLNTNWQKPTQIIDPYMFGMPIFKATCLWLKNLPKLQPTKIVYPYEHPTESFSPGNTRSLDRSRTYQCIANAMAEQWG